MIQITYDTALAALKAAVQEKGADFVYKKDENDECAYLHADEYGHLTVPGCLVGNAMLRLGINEAELEQYNTGVDAGNLVHWLGAADIAEASPQARDLLLTAQYQQDTGETWSKALSLAQEHVQERTATGLYAY